MQKTTFKNYKLSANMLNTLKKMDFKYPTEVQIEAITPALEGQDLLVQAPTGTGKTAAFGIPLIENLDSSRTLQALILCPTRELVIQTSRVISQLAESMKSVSVASVYGGESISRQFKSLRRKPQIVVATPGRLLDHLKRKSIQLDQIQVLVMDEADRMLDMGFRDDLQTICSKTPAKRQTLLFSATMSKEIMGIAKKYQNQQKNIIIQKNAEISESQIIQYFAEVSEKNKLNLLMNLLNKKNSRLSLVFVNTKVKADKLAKMLKANNIQAAAMHGDLRQNDRDKIMRLYRTKKIDVLVATDVAARGIDVPEIDIVVNYDIPNEDENYVHRIGRTGRANKTGVAYTFVCPKERRKLRLIAQKMKMKIERMPSEDKIPEPMETKKIA